MLLQLDALSRQETLDKVGNDDELHQWIVENLNINIPRVAACEEHNAPFEPIADLFFDRVDSAILVANRGGGKTLSASLWQFLNMKFKPKAECASVGAVEIQAKRAYQHFKIFQRDGAGDLFDPSTSLISETVWRNGSKYEVLTGSKNSVNGPHPQKVHRDEVELMDRSVYFESLQMEKSKEVDGIIISSQTFVTSTRKTSDGLMQELLDEVHEAERDNRRAPYKIYVYCVKDIVKTVDNCRVANPDLPEDEKCNCNVIQKGEWDTGVPRTLEDVCGGAFSRSDGFTPLADVEKTFMQSSKAVWEAQQECKRPYVEDISLPEFSRERHGIKEFIPDPDNGPIYQGIDFGGSHPHAVLWMQVLDYEIEAYNFLGEPKRLKQGTRVLFEELYIAEIGNNKLAELIVDTEREYKRRFPKFRVAGRFADPQAKAARLDFKAYSPPLLCSWPAVTRDREEHLKRLRDIVVDGFFAVDLYKCEMFVEEVESWSIDSKKSHFDHAVDATLYAASNAYVLEKKRGNSKHGTPGIIKKKLNGQPDPFNDELPGAAKSPLRSDISKAKSVWD